MDKPPIHFLAVTMYHPDDDATCCGAGVLLPDGQYIFAHNGGIAIYSSEQQALSINPGASIHRYPDIDPIINPAER